MSNTSQLAQANSSLCLAYGRQPCPEAENHWKLFLRVLLWGSTAELSKPETLEVLESPLLASPRAAMEATTGQLVEHLAAVPRGPQKASLVRAVADWWSKMFGEECSPEWGKSLDHYRSSLRQIRGLGPATVDELLLFVAQLPVFPLDRGTLRVAVRHGWLDLPLEEADAQSFFVRGLGDADIEPREFSLLLSRVAASHCGREPKCDSCPLQPLLPPNGPLNPDSC